MNRLQELVLAKKLLVQLSYIPSPTCVILTNTYASTFLTIYYSFKNESYGLPLGWRVSVELNKNTATVTDNCLELPLPELTKIGPTITSSPKLKHQFFVTQFTSHPRSCSEHPQSSSAPTRDCSFRSQRSCFFVYKTPVLGLTAVLALRDN